MIPKWLAVLWVVFLLSLAGCAARTVTVEVPVPVACKVPEVSTPAYAIDGVPENADIFTIVRALWATIEQHEAHEIETQAAIDACK